MKDAPKANRRGHFVMATCTVALLLMVYFLSTGPAWWLAQHGYISHKTVDRVYVIYEPLRWLMHWSQAFSELWQWYLSFWTE